MSQRQSKPTRLKPSITAISEISTKSRKRSHKSMSEDDNDSDVDIKYNISTLNTNIINPNYESIKKRRMNNGVITKPEDLDPDFYNKIAQKYQEFKANRGSLSSLLADGATRVIYDATIDPNTLNHCLPKTSTIHHQIKTRFLSIQTLKSRAEKGKIGKSTSLKNKTLLIMVNVKPSMITAINRRAKSFISTEEIQRKSGRITRPQMISWTHQNRRQYEYDGLSGILFVGKFKDQNAHQLTKEDKKEILQSVIGYQKYKEIPSKTKWNIILNGREQAQRFWNSYYMNILVELKEILASKTMKIVLDIGSPQVAMEDIIFRIYSIITVVHDNLNEICDVKKSKYNTMKPLPKPNEKEKKVKVGDSVENEDFDDWLIGSRTEVSDDSDTTMRNRS